MHWLFGVRTGDRQPLRRLLAGYLERDAGQIVVAQPAPGDKPRLVDGHGLCFNWSHSRDVAVVAVAVAAELGVDLEFRDRRVNAAALASRYFAPEEAALIDDPATDACRCRFLRLWTGKEAVLKAAGCGISGGLDRVVLAIDADSGLRLRRLSLQPPPDAHIRLRELAVPQQNLLASLAWSGAQDRLVHFRGVEPISSRELYKPMVAR